MTILRTIKARCDCGGALRRIDEFGRSFTVQCRDCRRCALLVKHSGLDLFIPLEDFLFKRGDGPSRRSLSDTSMAQRLVECLRRDEWPSAATVLDFAIESSGHLGALQYAVYAGVTAYDLDRVMGDGRAITKLVQRVPVQPYRFVRFETAYDWSDSDRYDFYGDDGEDES